MFPNSYWYLLYNYSHFSRFVLIFFCLFALDLSELYPTFSIYTLFATAPCCEAELPPPPPKATAFAASARWPLACAACMARSLAMYEVEHTSGAQKHHVPSGCVSWWLQRVLDNFA